MLQQLSAGYWILTPSQPLPTACYWSQEGRESESKWKKSHTKLYSFPAQTLLGKSQFAVGRFCERDVHNDLECQDVVLRRLPTTISAALNA